jgi:uncharacterized protein YqgC (DUF456 family)
MAGKILVSVLVGLVMLVGLVGVLIPVLPDVLLIWGAALGYGLVMGLEGQSVWFFGAITLLGVAALASDVWVSGISAKKSGASIWAVLTGFTVGAVGFFLLGPIGALIGLLLGIFLFQLIRLREVREAARTVLGTGLGCGASFVVKYLLALGMFVTWLLWVFLG